MDCSTKAFSDDSILFVKSKYVNKVSRVFGKKGCKYEIS